MLLASVDVNTSYLVFGTLASAVAIGMPVYKAVRTRLKNPASRRQMADDLYGPEATRSDPHPPKGLKERQEISEKQQRDTAVAVSALTGVVSALVDRFEAHTVHPPGHA